MRLSALILPAAAFTASLSVASVPAWALTRQEQANRQIALDLTAAMQAKDLAKASSYLADGYIQHNPNVPTGRAGFVAFFTKRWQGQPPSKPDAPVVTVVQGDLVSLIFRRPKPEPADPSKTYDSFWFDTYRIEHGKVAEHWDGSVKQPQPAAPAK